MRGLEQLVAEGDRRWLRAELGATRLLTVTLCELSDDDAKFAAEPWAKSHSADARFNVALRCDATAIVRASVRGQPLIVALQRLCRRAPVRPVARGIYSSGRANDLLAWLEKQRPSNARDALLPPLRRAVKRNHGFAILFDTV